MSNERPELFLEFENRGIFFFLSFVVVFGHAVHWQTEGLAVLYYLDGGGVAKRLVKEERK